MNIVESPRVLAMKEWLRRHGGGFHPNAIYKEEASSGCSIVAGGEISDDTTIVSCPFDLAITQDIAKNALHSILNRADPDEVTADWTERQWISCYICFHWIFPEEIAPACLAHFRYLDTLPSSDKLRTSLHFTSLELHMLQGTNLYGATVDRERSWREEWRQCVDLISSTNEAWGAGLTWERYLTASTYLSSRAFPSSLLSPVPSLTPSPSSGPVLIPGVDSLNHARGQPVSWVVSYPGRNAPEIKVPSLSLILHDSTPAGQELFNNYGQKSNSELILGYGFSLAENPGDTIILKIGGIQGKKWEIGRDSVGVDGLWDEIVHTLCGEPGVNPTYEDQLDASGMLLDMVQSLHDRLPKPSAHDWTGIRPDVASMITNYVQGQADILVSLMDFARIKERIAIKIAHEEGIELILED